MFKTIVAMKIWYNEKAKTEDKFIMALDTFYYSLIHCNYSFFLTRKIKYLGFGGISIFSHSSLVIK
jgi:hypothetical protein